MNLENEVDISEQFGKKLEEALKLKNLTRTELAQRIGVTDGLLGHYVSGIRQPSWARAVRLAKELGVELTFFLENSPSWHLLDPRFPDTYILRANLAFQELLGEGDHVRQFGSRLPLRIMRDPYAAVHRNEMPGDIWKSALEKIIGKHTKKIDEALEAPSKQQPLLPLYGFMRMGDFLKMIFMHPPYNCRTCEPNMAIAYLMYELPKFIEKGYNFILVDDIVVARELKEQGLSTYETVATIGDKLAIRRTMDFEISWSYAPDVIKKFNTVLDHFQINHEVMRTEELEKYCKAMSSASTAMGHMPNWNDVKVRNEWRDKVLEKMKDQRLVLGSFTVVSE